MSTGQTTVDEKLDEFNKPTLTITSPKFKSKFFVRKSNDGYSFYKVFVGKGSVPSELQGVYTKLSTARDSVLKYIDKSKETDSVARDRKADQRAAVSAKSV